MNQTFKRKTLAVSIAAALFGGMALAVAPIMTPVAFANQFEASVLDYSTMTKLFAGADLAVAANTQAGQVRIQQSPGTSGWAVGGAFDIIFSPGVSLVNTTTNAVYAVGETVAAQDLLPSPSNSYPNNGIQSVGPLQKNGAGEFYITAILASGGAFRIAPHITSTDAGVAKVRFASTVLGLITDLQSQNGVEIAEFSDTSATVTTPTGVTKIQTTLTNQPVADIALETYAAVAGDVTITLDKGTWQSAGTCTYTVSGTTTSCIANSVTLNGNQLKIAGADFVPGTTLLISGATMNASTLTEPDTAVNATVSATYTGFKTQEVQVAQTETVSGKGVTVGLSVDPTKDVVYVGRRTETVANKVTLTEDAAASLIENGTLNYTVSTGAFVSGANVTGSTVGPLNALCTAAGATSPVKIECAMVGPSVSTTPETVTLTLTPAAFDMLNAEVGDLNVTIDGTTWSPWTENVVKLAEVAKATTTTLDGDVTVLRLGTAAVTTTLPDIVIQENKAGALNWASYFVLGIDDGLKLTAPTSAKFNIFDKDGKAVTATVNHNPTGSMDAGTIVTTATERGIDVGSITGGLPTANGPYKMVISGLQVATVADTPEQSYNLTIAGSLISGAITPVDLRSDINAKPFMQSFPVVKTIDNATTTAWVDASGPITNLSAYANIMPGAAERGKMGSYYLMLQMPPQFGTDWSLWTLGAAGWTPVTPSTDVRELCSTMTSYQSGTLSDVVKMPLVVDTDMTVFKDVMVWMGYGVGATLFDQLAPCVKMLEDATYWYVYTVQ